MSWISRFGQHLTITTAIVICGVGCRPNVSTVASGGLPECPKSGDWRQVFQKRELTIANPATGELSIAARRTNIPEFHDCQRFIEDTKPPRYLSLFAIFSADSLAEKSARFDSVRDTLRTHSDSEAVDTAGRPLAVGEIYALDSGYAPLGIEHDFNCLFLYGKPGTPSGLEAKVIPVGGDERRCVRIDDARAAAGTPLQVYRHRFGDKDVPDVARWDWDSVAGRQHMGIGCGTAWCDIGAYGFTPSKPHAALVSSPQTRMVAVKGWYDEQRLAVAPPGSGPGSTLLDVGSFKGTFVPVPDLGTWDGPSGLAHFTGTWRATATVAIEPGSSSYLKKLNLAVSALPTMTDTVYLCHGKRAECPELKDHPPKCAADSGWWGKIVSFSGPPSKPRYFCVTRREHAGITIPGIVRWRWALHDETMWIRCLQGCCEVEAGSIDAI